jgi:hypothetical protein
MIIEVLFCTVIIVVMITFISMVVRAWIREKREEI